LSSAVSAGSRWNRWNTNPIVRRYAACSFLESPVTSRSPTRIRPSSGSSIAPTTWRSVDFPEPDGPMTAATWPDGTANVTRSRAVTVTAVSDR